MLIDCSIFFSIKQTYIQPLLDNILEVILVTLNGPRNDMGHHLIIIGRVKEASMPYWCKDGSCRELTLGIGIFVIVMDY